MPERGLNIRIKTILESGNSWKELQKEIKDVKVELKALEVAGGKGTTEWKKYQNQLESLNDTKKKLQRSFGDFDDRIVGTTKDLTVIGLGIKETVKGLEDLGSALKDPKMDLGDVVKGMPLAGTANGIRAESVGLQMAEGAVKEVAEVSISGMIGDAHEIISILNIGADGFVGKMLKGFDETISLARGVVSIVNSILAISKGGFLGFVGGGFTGSGNKYEPAGIVHKGEFVIDKETTNRIGVRNLYGIFGGQRGLNMSFADGGFVNGSGAMVNVYISSAIDGVEFFRVNEPRYQNFLKFKKL